MFHFRITAGRAQMYLFAGWCDSITKGLSPGQYVPILWKGGGTLFLDLV